MTSPQVARAARELHPLRLGYSIWSDKNPMMGAVALMAAQVRSARTTPASGHPFVAMQEQFSWAMTQALELSMANRRDQIDGADVPRDLRLARDPGLVRHSSQDGGPPRRRPGQSPSTKAALDCGNPSPERTIC